MNNINFNQSGGFPFETETLHEMQKCWRILNSFGEIIAPLAIVKGCTLTGSNVSDGFVYINGELLEFKGGLQQTTVIIIETPISVEFESDSFNQVYFERYATFGTGTITHNWADFKRGMPTSEISAALAAKEDKTFIQTLVERIELLEARPLANVPIGMIAIWGRPANEIPSGWVEYLELQGRTPIGLDPNYDSNTNGDLQSYNLQTLNYAGGVREHQLTINEMPQHTHGFSITAAGDSGGGAVATGTGNESSGNYNMRNTGGNEKHTNMQPYRVVHFIKYVG